MRLLKFIIQRKSLVYCLKVFNYSTNCYLLVARNHVKAFKILAILAKLHINSPYTTGVSNGPHVACEDILCFLGIFKLTFVLFSLFTNV